MKTYMKNENKRINKQSMRKKENVEKNEKKINEDVQMRRARQVFGCPLADQSLS